MRSTRQYQVTGALGLCLLSVPLVELAWMRPAAPSGSEMSTRFGRPRRGGPLEAALWEARGWRLRAMQLVNTDREALEAWDPEAESETNQEPLRRRMMARDRGGYLRRACVAARQAAALAQTREEAVRAQVLLARVECDAGHHDRELQAARRLMALAPRSEDSLLALQHAALCNRLPALAEQARAALEALRNGTTPAAPSPLLPGWRRPPAARPAVPPSSAPRAQVAIPRLRLIARSTFSIRAGESCPVWRTRRDLSIVRSCSRRTRDSLSSPLSSGVIST